MSENAYTIGKLTDQLNEKDRLFILDFIKWFKTRHTAIPFEDLK
jgi:hypothetical protein